MGLRETWNELGTGLQLLVGLGVGAVLLVAAIPIVVVLAAVVGSFVLGVGDPGAAGPEAPQASFEFAYADGAVTITHDGGDTIDAPALILEVADRAVGWPDSDGDVTAGDSVEVDAAPGERITVVWDGAGSSKTLATFDVPDAE